MRRHVEVDPKAARAALPIIGKISFAGEVTVTAPEERVGYKGRLFWADAGNLVYSKIRVKQGSLCIVPDPVRKLAVSAEYPVYEIIKSVADADYLALVVRSAPFMRLLEGLSHGGSTKTRIPPEEFERQRIPLPPLAVQRKIVAAWEAVRRRLDDAYHELRRPISDLDAELRRMARMDALSRHCVIARWRDLDSLDMKSARAALFRLDNPAFPPLGEFAEEATELVKPWEQPDKEWPVYGVNNKEGVVFSHLQKGKDFNAPYKRIRRDWFFHNPTRSSVGSLGIVPDVPADAITSPEYQVWRITKGLLPGYVAALIGTSFFVDLIQVHRVGAVKQRLYVENLLRIPIPVIAESTQRRIVKERERAVQRVADAKARADAAKADVEAMILGTKPVE
ncbi:MAG: hypothetical protein NTU53_04950 [Planctomycetota bacterium]|nr:hypothetical protein [Planctomycetota bacterium]